MKILAIDDNADNLTVLKAFVADMLPGAVLLTAPNGARGFELAQTENPDVILLDVVMPGMDGYEVCRLVKADPRLQVIPVLFLSAIRTDQDSHVKALEVGADGFLSKPFDEVELAVQIRAMAKIKAAAMLQREQSQSLASLVAERTRELEHNQNITLKLLDELKAENEARKTSEQALRSLTSRQEAILASIPDIIMEIDANRRYCWANAAGREFFGDDVIGRDVAYYSVGDSCARLDQDPLSGGDDRVLYTERWQKRKDGQKRLLAWWCRTLKDLRGNVTGAIHTARDITERKQAEEEQARQMDELRRWQAVTIGREGRVSELKREVNALMRLQGEKPRYESVEAE